MEQLPQVRYIARRIHERLPRHVPLEDLVHAGVVGLIDALNKFDQSKHVQFGSYAKFRIRGAILDSLRELDWGPRELRRKARRVEEAHRKLCARAGPRAHRERDGARTGYRPAGVPASAGRTRQPRSRQPAHRVAVGRQRRRPVRLPAQTRGHALLLAACVRR